jgi:hypothetical protein
MSVIKCPSAPNVAPATTNLPMTNYVYCIGDVSWSLNNNLASVRGLFGMANKFALRDVVDGTSNTAMMSETIQWDKDGSDLWAVNGYGAVSRVNTQQPDDCVATWVNREFVNYSSTTANNRDRSPGGRWSDGIPAVTSFNTILPPNSAVCADFAGNNGVLPPKSMHVGGVHLLLADGSVRFISENIHSGNVTASVSSSGSSNFGVWGALGTRESGEVSGQF